MTEDRLFDAIDAYGGDLHRWPDALAARAREAAAADPRFAAALRETQALDEAVTDALAVPPPPLGYATRVAARAIEAGTARRDRFSLRWTLALGSGWAAAAAVAGVVYADLVAQSDPDILSLAEVALGAAQFVTGN
jgi:hypothetical protein